MLRIARQVRSAVGVDCIKWLAMLMLGHATIVHAQDSSELNDEFLEYLGNMESSQDNWTDFSTERAVPAADNAATPARNTSANSSDAHSSSSASNKSTDGKHNSGPTTTTELKANK